MKDYNNCYGMPNKKTIEKEKFKNYVSMISPEQKYPVTYTIKHDGTKVYENTWLLGKDLTMPQIKQLVHFNMPYPNIPNEEVIHLKSLLENRDAVIETLEFLPIKFARWCMKYANARDIGNGLCYEYEGKEYNTDELFEVFKDLELTIK